jgi:DNA-binding transcriptional LysR family regulator
MIVLSPMLREVFAQAPSVSVVVEPLSPNTFDDMDCGLRWQTLFEDSLVCVLSADHPVTADPVELTHLQEFPYAGVAAFSPDTMVADQRLLSLGIRPACGSRTSPPRWPFRRDPDDRRATPAVR